MGLGIFKGSGCTATRMCQDPRASAPSKKKASYGDPDPRNFRIVRYVGYSCWEGGEATVVEVRYPDSRNYEGRKVMVYRCGFERICREKFLDPHFCDDGSHLSPFARFEPTADGWEAALALARALHQPNEEGKLTWPARKRCPKRA
jgi:hypothetical protein